MQRGIRIFSGFVNGLLAGADFRRAGLGNLSKRQHSGARFVRPIERNDGARRPGEIEPSGVSGSFRSGGESTREPDLAPLSQMCGEGKSLANIGLFDIGEVRQQLLDSAAGRRRLDDHSDGHTHTSDAWFAAHDLGIHRDAFESLHDAMIAHR